jgi:glutaredoxin
LHTYHQLKKSFFLAFTLFATFSGWAQYKVISPDGSTTYTDQPPVDSKFKVEKLGDSSFASPALEAALPLPYAIAIIARNSPVTLYTSENCTPCAQGRSLLQNRGIPYTERSIATPSDLEALKSKSMENSFPILEIGRNFLQGFETGRWNAALTDAAYPEKIELPPNYQNGKKSPLTSPTATSTSPLGATPKPEERIPSPPSQPNNGFQFQK